jgi:hypothetical protein
MLNCEHINTHIYQFCCLIWYSRATCGYPLTRWVWVDTKLNPSRVMNSLMGEFCIRGHLCLGWHSTELRPIPIWASNCWSAQIGILLFAPKPIWWPAEILLRPLLTASTPERTFTCFQTHDWSWSLIHTRFLHALKELYVLSDDVVIEFPDPLVF